MFILYIFLTDFDLMMKFFLVYFFFLQLLSSSVKVILNQPSPFANLMSLKICPELCDEPYKKLTMSTEVKNYMLDSSPRATITVVSREVTLHQETYIHLPCIILIKWLCRVSNIFIHIFFNFLYFHSFTYILVLEKYTQL